MPFRVFLEDDAESDEPDDRSIPWASCAWRQTSITSAPQSCLAFDAKHSSELATSITLKQHHRKFLTVMHNLLDQASSEQHSKQWQPMLYTKLYWTPYRPNRI
jgi:hypothetical protein